MRFFNNFSVISILLLIGILLAFFHVEGISYSIIQMIMGLIIVVLVGEPMVEGLKKFGISFGFSPHVIGIISSLASNLPEGVMSLFMIMSPELREVTILTVMLASAFNGLLLGILVVMMTFKGGVITLKAKELEHDVEIMRIAIALCGIVFGAGVILNIFSDSGSVILPLEVPIFLLLSYIGYLFFVSNRHGHEIIENNTVLKEEAWLSPILLGLVGIVISAELISGASEYLVHMFDLHLVIAATLIGFAGSIPEHGIALIGARYGHVEIGISNLLSGIIQSIMLIFPIIALLVPVNLDGYVLYQFLAISVTLWIVKKAILDDHKFTLDEGLSILMIHVLGILLFDELGLLI